MPDGEKYQQILLLYKHRKKTPKNTEHSRVLESFSSHVWCETWFYSYFFRNKQSNILSELALIILSLILVSVVCILSSKFWYILSIKKNFLPGFLL